MTGQRQNARRTQHAQILNDRLDESCDIPRSRPAPPLSSRHSSGLRDGGGTEARAAAAAVLPPGVAGRGGGALLDLRRLTVISRYLAPSIRRTDDGGSDGNGGGRAAPGSLSLLTTTNRIGSPSEELLSASSPRCRVCRTPVVMITVVAEDGEDHGMNNDDGEDRWTARKAFERSRHLREAA